MVCIFHIISFVLQRLEKITWQRQFWAQGKKCLTPQIISQGWTLCQTKKGVIFGSSLFFSCKWIKIPNPWCITQRLCSGIEIQEWYLSQLLKCRESGQNLELCVLLCTLYSFHYKGHCFSFKIRRRFVRQIGIWKRCFLGSHRPSLVRTKYFCLILFLQWQIATRKQMHSQPAIWCLFQLAKYDSFFATTTFI